MITLREAAQAVIDGWDSNSDTQLLPAIFHLRAALAAPENRPCTCHPDDNPPQPCAQRYALTECKALAQPEAEPVVIGPEWTPCVKLPIVVHVREQRPGEQHVSTREGITPVKPDDLIMRGVAGEEYPIGRELFAKTYRIGDKLPPDDAEPAAWAVTCDGSAVEARLTETAANLIAQNLREKNRARGFDWRVHPLYLHPPQPCAQRYALTECKALAQPETTAEPAAWLNRYHAAMVTQDRATAAVMGFTTPLYAHPPRDEWRSAVHEELFTSCIYSAKHARDPRAAIDQHNRQP